MLALGTEMSTKRPQRTNRVDTVCVAASSSKDSLVSTVPNVGSLPQRLGEVKADAARERRKPKGQLRLFCCFRALVYYTRETWTYWVDS